MLWRETPTASASCCCVHPRSRRSSRTRLRTLPMDKLTLHEAPDRCQACLSEGQARRAAARGPAAARWGGKFRAYRSRSARSSRDLEVQAGLTELPLDRGGERGVAQRIGVGDVDRGGLLGGPHEELVRTGG